MNALKQQLLSGWNLMRTIRLALGAWVLVVAIQTGDWVLGAVSALFIIMALTNTGCCGVNGCAVPYSADMENREEDTKEKEIETIK